MFQGHEQHTLENFGGKGAPAKSYREGLDTVQNKIKSDVVESDVESLRAGGKSGNTVRMSGVFQKQSRPILGSIAANGHFGIP